jgi:hypothetical protein
MPEKLSLEVREDYMYIAVSGDFNLNRAMDFFNLTLDECSKIDYTKILIDIRNLECLPAAIDSYVFENLVPRLQKKRSIWVACLVSVDVIPADKFGEKTAQDTGVTVKVTADLDEALGWLRVEDGRAYRPQGAVQSSTGPQ